MAISLAGNLLLRMSVMPKAGVDNSDLKQALRPVPPLCGICFYLKAKQNLLLGAVEMDGSMTMCCSQENPGLVPSTFIR